MNYKELRKLYPMLSNKEISARLGVSAGWVATAAHRMGWKKEPSYLSGVNRENGRKSRNKTEDYETKEDIHH